jgi:hypothetical protein
VKFEHFPGACAEPTTPLGAVVAEVLLGQAPQKRKCSGLSVKSIVRVRENAGLELVPENSDRNFVWMRPQCTAQGLTFKFTRRRLFFHLTRRFGGRVQRLVIRPLSHHVD